MGKIWLLGGLFAACTSGGETRLLFDEGPSDAGRRETVCGGWQGSEPSTLRAVEPGRLRIGTGRRQFEEIEDELELVRGAQGGFHIWVSVFAYGREFNPGDIWDLQLETQWVGEPSSTVAVGALVAPRSLDDEQGVEVQAMLGWVAKVHKSTCAEGQEVDIRVSLSSHQREAMQAHSEPGVWRGERTVVIRVPEAYRGGSCF